MSVDFAALAARVDQAAVAGEAVEQLTAGTELTVADAYRVQEALVARRLGRGERLVGVKLGLTSAAKMAQMGVDEVIWGRLTDAMSIADGDAVSTGGLIHPRVEPEVAFRLGAGGEPVAVAAALEVIDSRYADFRFTLPDVVADNTSAAGFVLGPWRPIPAGLANFGVLLEVDGQVVETGSTAAILGDPWRALQRGLKLAGGAGLVPQPGWVLLAGAATAAVPLPGAGHVRAVVEQLGGASLEVRP
ncbi:4-oxalocrotonate decarboxylase [Natronosporangium hydrolyticum]|uniref:4-oxalocrotonate decarboxylase n=1 Tax=Natronosporangium hydrolyticum TaxID=2811111 RepID=A0A895YIY2_9ACTN|nr:4-oxalocrotonate decarboxylase [Natronosporangium hydrolyticum]QSB15992.1 4-oxalocrotonate decarboxylase [Natronosporangium hydrolyticum]